MAQFKLAQNTKWCSLVEVLEGSPQSNKKPAPFSVKRFSAIFFLLLTFQSILIGVAGFWGGVFCMGLLYLLAVLTKRVFKPEEAEKIAE